MKIEKFRINTVEEFISLKKEPFFNLIRQQAKVVSLAFLFGRGAQSFAIRDLDVAWDDERVESFIQDKSNTGYNIDLISNIRLIAWIVLIIIIIYLFKCLVI